MVDMVFRDITATKHYAIPMEDCSPRSVLCRLAESDDARSVRPGTHPPYENLICLLGCSFSAHNTLSQLRHKKLEAIRDLFEICPSQVFKWPGR